MPLLYTLKDEIIMNQYTRSTVLLTALFLGGNNPCFSGVFFSDPTKNHKQFRFFLSDTLENHLPDGAISNNLLEKKQVAFTHWVSEDSQTTITTRYHPNTTHLVIAVDSKKDNRVCRCSFEPPLENIMSSGTLRGIMYIPPGRSLNEAVDTVGENALSCEVIPTPRDDEHKVCGFDQIPLQFGVANETLFIWDKRGYITIFR